MRYAQIRSMDISNGEGIGVSLFVQGCPYHCKGCFNQETWDFSGGKEWTQEVKNKFIKLVGQPFVKRVSILGGEPLARQNVEDVFLLVAKIKSLYPDKKIWLWTGSEVTNQNFSYDITDRHFKGTYDGGTNYDIYNHITDDLIHSCDYIVDGRFVEELMDSNLRFRGSSNQRIIDVKQSLVNKKIILWEG